MTTILWKKEKSGTIHYTRPSSFDLWQDNYDVPRVTESLITTFLEKIGTALHSYNFSVL